LAEVCNDFLDGLFVSFFDGQRQQFAAIR